MRILLTTMIIAGMAIAGRPAFAQGGGSSVNSIIKSLTPSGDLSKGTTRGIRMVPQTAPGPAPATAPSAMPARAETARATASRSSGNASVDLTVLFKTGSAELSPKAEGTLDKLGAALSSKALAPYRFRVEGHTDTVGSAAANQVLSQQRADAVVAYLEKRFGVAPSRLEAVGMGEKGLLVPTGDQVPEPRNRRVHIVNMGAK